MKSIILNLLQNNIKKYGWENNLAGRPEHSHRSDIFSSIGYVLQGRRNILVSLALTLTAVAGGYFVKDALKNDNNLTYYPPPTKPPITAPPREDTTATLPLPTTTPIPSTSIQIENNVQESNPTEKPTTIVESESEKEPIPIKREFTLVTKDSITTDIDISELEIREDYSYFKAGLDYFEQEIDQHNLDNPDNVIDKYIVLISDKNSYHIIFPNGLGYDKVESMVPQLQNIWTGGLNPKTH